MSLVAHLDTMSVGPCHPLLREVFEQQVAERLAIVCQHLVAVIHDS